MMTGLSPVAVGLNSAAMKNSLTYTVFILNYMYTVLCIYMCMFTQIIRKIICQLLSLLE
jgi:hypothetical protein